MGGVKVRPQTQRTKMDRLREKMIEECIDILDNGEVKMTEQGPIRVRPSASMLNVVRQLLKDNGIDQEPIEPTRILTDELPFVEPKSPDLIEGPF